MGRNLHVVFFPFMAQGHIIPSVDIAKLFAVRGVRVSIITTPVNARRFTKAIEKAASLGIEIGIHLIKFPTSEAGLPEGCESLDIVASLGGKLIRNFMEALTMMQEPLEKLLEETRPDCLISDMFFPWTLEVTSKLKIPRLVFHGMNYFSLSTSRCLLTLEDPLKDLNSDSDPFTIPLLPGDIKFTGNMIAPGDRQNSSNPFSKIIQASVDADKKSFGVLVNSFNELEPVYADFYRNTLGVRAWSIGPVSLYNRGLEDKTIRGGRQAAITDNECITWLDSKKPDSVIYVCFGSMNNITSVQLKQIAMALEDSSQNFIWVVKTERKGIEDWLPEGFEERMEGKGLIIRGWAPQVLILDHKAVGVFVTHCGWNSALEGISAGKTMITWPLFAEQFYNEKLVTEVLKIGVSVGIQGSDSFNGEFVQSKDIAKAIRKATVDPEASEMRIRAKKLGKLARNCIEPDGSSSSEFNSLLHELAGFSP